MPKFPVELTLDNVSLAMPGAHQVQNAAAAISAFLLFDDAQLEGRQPTSGRLRAVLRTGSRTSHPVGYVADPPPGGRRLPCIHTALQNASIPLRFEIIRRSENSVVFDGAHNRASMQALVKTLVEMYPTRRRLLIFGASQDKDVAGMFAEITGHFEHIFLTQSSHSTRRFPPQELRQVCPLPDEKVSVVEDCKDAWEQCMCMASSGDVICITGSLYLAAELRRRVANGS